MDIKERHRDAYCDGTLCILSVVLNTQAYTDDKFAHHTHTKHKRQKSELHWWIMTTSISWLWYCTNFFSKYYHWGKQVKGTWDLSVLFLNNCMRIYKMFKFKKMTTILPLFIPVSSAKWNADEMAGVEAAVLGRQLALGNGSCSQFQNDKMRGAKSLRTWQHKAHQT